MSEILHDFFCDYRTIERYETRKIGKLFRNGKADMEAIRL